MQSRLSHLVTAVVVVCITLVLWSGLQYLGQDEYSYQTKSLRPPARMSRPNLQGISQPTPDAIDTVSSKTEQLEIQLQAYRASLSEHVATPTAQPVADSLPGAGSRSDVPSQDQVESHLTGFAYAFYATSDAYACSAMVNMQRLQNLLNTTIPIHMLVSKDVSDVYLDAFKSAGVRVHVEESPKLHSDASGGYYEDCLLKLLAFKLHSLDPTLKRVLALDSDQLVMKNLDHLFIGLPDVDLAAPRAYWLAKDLLASTFMMINLSDRLWNTVQKALDDVGYNEFDMDLLNDLLVDTVMMLSGEYVTLNSHWEDWNLPNWYHPTTALNMTTINLINSIASAGKGTGKRQVPEDTVDRPAPLAQASPGPHLTLIPGVVHPAKQSSLPLWDISRPTEAYAGLPFATHRPHLIPTSDPAIPIAPPSAAVAPRPSQEPAPRFPATHPFTEELHRLQDAAAVIHFTAQGKPWGRAVEAIRATRPDAHPLLAEQFQLWRDSASQVCPGGIPTLWTS